ncbi:hypothetical protein [Nocardia sp. NBC_01388]|uniref:hypothetical protein n=1 Tax=Nocardia sp. NBC_01388 TaxID=2903596 RepID=UPI002F9110CD
MPLAEFETSGDPGDLEATARRLTKSGFLAADSLDCFRDGLDLLVTHLRHESVPPREILAQRIENYAARPRPYLPRPARNLATSETFTAWINPGRILLKFAGTQSFIHDNSNAARRCRTGTGQRDYEPVEPMTGIAEFAERIAAEHGDSAGLAELFGEPKTPAIQAQAWNVPSGLLFRIETNGNHRLTALAALGVPCVLAEVRLHTGLFDTSPRADDETGDIQRYRRLLQTFGIAAFSEDGAMGAFGVSTRWPMLIRDPDTAVKSLTALEQIIGSPITADIGRLPRSWFTDADELRTASHDLAIAVDDFTKHRSGRRWTRLLRR